MCFSDLRQLLDLFVAWDWSTYLVNIHLKLNISFLEKQFLGCHEIERIKSVSPI
jgi:hypothetical protein